MRYTLNINGQVVTARAGETLLDAAMVAKILIPHDCATGQCETCRVRIPWGEIDDNQTAYGDTVLACQARVKGDATVTFETAPSVQTIAGKVETITSLSHDVAEVIVRTRDPAVHRPGQYAKLAFDGFPPREYSYSAPLTGEHQQDQAIFQIKRLANGKVSPALGTAITPGHKMKLRGPFGSAFLREQETGPVVLASSGTGFAPIWSLARAIVATGSKRPLTLVTGVRTPEDMYMLPAFKWLEEHHGIDIRVASKRGARDSILSGTADQHLPPLDEETIVHVAGNPEVVSNTKQIALAAQATCYADPFTASKERPTLLESLFRLRFS